MAATFSLTTYIPLKNKPLYAPSITSSRIRGLRSSNISTSKTAALTASTETTSLTPKEVSRRPTVEFHPSVWDGHFTSHAPDVEKAQRASQEKIEELKKQVKTQLSSLADHPNQHLVFIDKLQRFGVAYHFEAEIENALQNMYDNVPHEEGDLYTVSLRFRVLRQAGHPMSPSVFDKFKDEPGDFDEKLSSDVEGLLSLYQAAYIRCQGEDILDEAIAFTTDKLKSMVRSNLSSPIAGQVERALELPLHKRIQRAEARYYISVHQDEQSPLLELAKLDYNVVQLLHQSEINEVSRWWKARGIVSKLPFQMRDRLVEGYTMMMGMFPEPKYTSGRIFMAKLFGLLTVLDDTFDVYGTLEELQPLTDAISRWSIDDKDELPEFVKVIAAELFGLFDELAEEMKRRGQSNTVPYFITQIQNYVRCLFEEAKWFHNKEVPTLEEWLELGATTCGADVLVIGPLVFHYELATKEALDWALSGANVIRSCGRIGRLIDDINTFKPEIDRGNIASSVTCYMKEHGVEEEEAIEKLEEIIEQEWMIMNKDCLKPTAVPMRLLLIPIDVIRLAEVYYLYGDGYTNSKVQTKDLVASLLVKPVPV